ncbi:hypothetical protein RJ639_000603 [Escallonia herrerae]|uniref:Transposase-associated domain-containing protein n=1 Tax=Escallonia herrerae TaxID=1293975 RepID=A0AA89BHD9_9ASTE|nr:hypothetical protein RJ639_000603 [Escallonia herrerae]
MKEDTMDKEWLNLSRASPVYYQGVNSFLDFAFASMGTTSGEILCPCTRCVNCLFQNRVTVEEHLVRRGFASHYRVWTEHGKVEGDANRTPDDDVGNEGATTEVDAEVNVMPKLVNDVFRNQFQDDPCTKAAKFEMYMNEANQELYPGCKSETKLDYFQMAEQRRRLFQEEVEAPRSEDQFSQAPEDDRSQFEGAQEETDDFSIPAPKKVRGPTMCASVWATEMQKFVGYNNYGQMYTGAEREMTAWLGTLARKSNIFPIHIASFRDFTQKRYTTNHPLVKKHIFERLDSMWRCWRYELKQKYFVEGDRAKSLRSLNDPRVDKS